MAESKPTQEVEWIPSACSMCYAMCSILVRRENGVVTKIEGNPASPVGNGRLCGKGAGAIMTLYDPNRVKVPLIRTNPKKGLGIDPGWKEISWAEALDIIADNLRKIREDDPRKLMVQRTTTSNTVKMIDQPFVNAFGTPNYWVAGGGVHCGNAAHFFGGLMHASWSVIPDFEFCQLAIYFGASKGHSAGHVACTTAQQASDARVRGIKMVVVDPMCNFAASKAGEWVPIRVGTDAALALAMVNVILNELNIQDDNYLRDKTNGPYLIGPDGLYMRDQKTGKPLLWCVKEGRARTYDDPELTEPALEGTFQVNGVKCQPAFQLLKEHVRKYTLERASEITTVPAATIRRLATEFGQTARVGSTIVLDGVQLPYRPVAAIFFRGAQGHRNAAYNAVSINLLNQVVGAADVPGGCLGFNPVCFGFPETGQLAYVPWAGPDGLMSPGVWQGTHIPYPLHKPAMPERMMITELFPMAMSSPAMASADQEELWQKVNLPYRPEMLINFGCNSVMSVGNAETVAASLMKIPFIVSFDLFLTELTDLADIVLPDTCYLERLDPAPYEPFIFAHPAGRGQWGWTIRQPAAEPQSSQRSYVEVLLELADRIGLREPLNLAINSFWIKGSHQLEPDKKYSWEEICDHILKNRFGEDKGLNWFKKNGVVTWPKQVKEVYWRPFVKVRVPIYFEFFKTVAEELKPLAQACGLDVDYRHFEPLPEWYPCTSHKSDSPDHDLYAFYYRDVLHTNSFTMENPWLDEAARMDPFTYNVAINADVAQKKGIADGDLVWVESAKGRKVKGRASLTEAIHPEGLGIAACAGHWTPGQPIARGKGVFFNELLELDMDHACPVTKNLDLCTKVRVYKSEE